jgi:hypothetical protein
MAEGARQTQEAEENSEVSQGWVVVITIAGGCFGLWKYRVISGQASKRFFGLACLSIVLACAVLLFFLK